MAYACKESKHVHCIFKGSLQLFIFFISPILALCECVLTIVVSLIHAETDNFKEGKNAILLHKAAKVSMLIVYLGIDAIVNILHIHLQYWFFKKPHRQFQFQHHEKWQRQQSSKRGEFSLGILSWPNN